MIFGKFIKGDFTVQIGLAKTIFGIGPKVASQLTARVGIYPRCKVNQLTEQQILELNKEISQLTVEGHLKQKINSDIQMKRAINSRAGIRHAQGFPVRGQKTKTNGATARRLNKIPRYAI